MKSKTNNSGFTLIELVVALFILSLVLSSAIYSVQQYADERVLLKDRFFAHNVAWNQLMNRYQVSQAWTAKSNQIVLKKKGKELQGRTDWVWELEIEKAMGQDLYRYQVMVESPDNDKTLSTLAVYLIKSN